MNAEKYRKIYLQENWGNNSFRIFTFYVGFQRIPVYRNKMIEVLDYGRNHPKTVSGEAYWINYNELCVGYILESNHEVFRPIFQHKRQDTLNKVHAESHSKFWNKIYLRYMLSLPKFLPMECSTHICSMLYGGFRKKKL